MSEQRYVNRVDQTPFQKLEGQKFGHHVSEGEFPIAESVPGWNLPVVEESDDPQAGQTGPGQDEDPRDNIGNSFEHYEVDPAKVLSVLSLVDEKFKQQVIAAFKHLGLPVNKFFPGS